MRECENYRKLPSKSELKAKKEQTVLPSSLRIILKVGEYLKIPEIGERFFVKIRGGDLPSPALVAADDSLIVSLQYLKNEIVFLFFCRSLYINFVITHNSFYISKFLL